MRVVIIGNGIIANLGALYLRKRLEPSTEIVVVGPADRGGLPLVGESTIEITAQFLEEQLGLGPYLARHHYPKYGLTYYFKLDPDDPADRTYSVSCNERDPVDLKPVEGWDPARTRPPAWLVNREVLDRDIQAMVAEDPSIEHVEGMVRDVRLDAEAGHALTVRESGGTERQLDATWVIDASGRSRFLAKRLGLIDKPQTGQRDCFWFRLTGFDRDILKDVDALGPFPPAAGEPYHYDRYYTTHHFMGRGNWIWLIPMKSEDDTELISIGFTWNPDVYEGEVRSVEEFIEQVRGMHPVVTELVESGHVEDTNLMRNYRYYVDQVYSPDRWSIVGDAAFAPDPLFSNGLAFSTIQLEQVGEMIARDAAGTLSPGYVDTLEQAFWAPVKGGQSAITHWYESMHDAYLCSLRLNAIEIAYFYFVLPMVVNRCHYDEDRLPLWRSLQPGKSAFDLPPQLLAARERFDRPTAEHFVYRGKEKVNLRALEKVDDLREVKAQMQAGAALYDQYTKDVLARLDAIESSPPELAVVS